MNGYTASTFVWIAALALCGCVDPHARRDDDPGISGRSYAHVIAEYGPPEATYEFRASEIDDEFRVELLNLFAPSDPEAGRTPIRECWWPRGRGHLVVWFAQDGDDWRAVDVAYSDPETPF